MTENENAPVLRYHRVVALERQQALAAFREGTVSEITEALLAITFHDPERAWVESWCFRFARPEAVEVRSIAALCLGHLARIHRTLTLDVALPLLDELAQESALNGRINDVWDDIELFIPHSRPLRRRP